MVFYRNYRKRSFRKPQKTYRKSGYISKAVKRYVNKTVTRKGTQIVKTPNNTNPAIYGTPAYEYYQLLDAPLLNVDIVDEANVYWISSGGIIRIQNDTAGAQRVRIAIVEFSTAYQAGGAAINTYDKIYDASVTTRFTDGIQILESMQNQVKVHFHRLMCIPALDDGNSYKYVPFYIKMRKMWKQNTAAYPRLALIIGCTSTLVNFGLTQWTCGSYK